MMAEIRPSDDKARTLRPSLMRARMVPPRFSRTSVRLPPVCDWMLIEVTNSGRSCCPTRPQCALPPRDRARRRSRPGGSRIPDRRAGQSLGDRPDRHGDRVAGPQTAHDDVDRLGKLIGETPLSPSTHEMQDDERGKRNDRDPDRQSRHKIDPERERDDQRRRDARACPGQRGGREADAGLSMQRTEPGEMHEARFRAHAIASQHQVRMLIQSAFAHPEATADAASSSRLVEHPECERRQTRRGRADAENIQSGSTTSGMAYSGLDGSKSAGPGRSTPMARSSLRRRGLTPVATK